MLVREFDNTDSLVVAMVETLNNCVSTKMIDNDDLASCAVDEYRLKGYWHQSLTRSMYIPDYWYITNVKTE